MGMNCMLSSYKTFPVPLLLLMIRGTKRAHERNHLFNFIIRKLRLHRHSRITKRRATLLDDGKNMTVRELIHIRAVRMIARLRVERGRSRAIPFATRTVARATGFDVGRFTQRDILRTHIELKIRRIRACWFCSIARGWLIVIELPAGTSAGRNSENESKYKKGKEPMFHDLLNMFNPKLISIFF